MKGLSPLKVIQAVDRLAALGLARREDRMIYPELKEDEGQARGAAQAGVESRPVSEVAPGDAQPDHPEPLPIL